MFEIAMAAVPFLSFLLIGAVALGLHMYRQNRVLAEFSDE